MVATKTDQQFRRFSRAGVLGGQVVGAWRLGPVLAVVEHVRGLTVELAVYGALDQRHGLVR